MPTVFTAHSYRVLLVVEEATGQQHKVAQLPRLVLASLLVQEPSLLNEWSRTCARVVKMEWKVMIP